MFNSPWNRWCHFFFFDQRKGSRSKANRKVRRMLIGDNYRKLKTLRNFCVSLNKIMARWYYEKELNQYLSVVLWEGINHLFVSLLDPPWVEIILATPIWQLVLVIFRNPRGFSTKIRIRMFHPVEYLHLLYGVAERNFWLRFSEFYTTPPPHNSVIIITNKKN